jgi:hypothetical protein
MGGVLGVVVGLRGLLGEFISSGKAAVAIAVLSVIAGSGVMVMIRRGWHRRLLQRRAAVVAAGVVAPLVVGMGLGLAVGRLLGEDFGQPVSAAPGTRGSVVPAGPTHTEVAANRRGTPVFGDAQGAAVPPQVPASIPYLTEVQIRCKVKNTSAMTSVTYWYELASEPWRGMYAPSDTFANGDPIGTVGTHNVDTEVPDCRAISRQPSPTSSVH